MKTSQVSSTRFSLVALTLAASVAGLAREARAASAVNPPCGGLERVNIYQVTRQKTNAQGETYLEYSLVPILKNTQPDNIWGAQLSFPSVAKLPDTKKYTSVPFLLPRNTNLFSIEVATSSTPFNAPYRATPGTIQIPQTEFYNNMEQTLCTKPTALDPLFTASENRVYNIQRSNDLGTWSTVATVAYDFLWPMVWIPHAWIKSPTNPSSEFYRIDVVCTEGADCDTQVGLLSKSQIDLRNTYLK